VLETKKLTEEKYRVKRRSLRCLCELDYAIFESSLLLGDFMAGDNASP